MAASIVIEEERGTYTRRPHTHNGYYAGDFRTARPAASLSTAFALRSVTPSTAR